MSLNLCFKHTLPSGKTVYSEFPFQTPTSLTEAVLSTQDKQIQLSIIFNWLYVNEWLFADLKEVMLKIEAELKDPNTTLGMT